MPLPNYERVVYSKNPLAEVICQLRFPAILRIEAEVPAAFQESIRNEYPLYEAKRVPDPRAAMPAELAKLVPPDFFASASRQQYGFTSADEKWLVTLGTGAISLTAKEYVRWEEFKQHLRDPLDALLNHYSPTFFSRVGLRYRDIVRRSRLELQDVPWPELLRPHIAGEIGSPDVGDEIYHAARELGIRFEQDRGQVLVRHGLASDQHTEETCFVIDSDYFREARTETNNAIELLDYFNDQARRLFRWCIQEHLHAAMGPKPV